MKRVLVVGGAGFVGSNLLKKLLVLNPEEIIVVDNFLSAERFNLPNDPRISLIVGSIADPAVLAMIPRDIDYAFHLATYHGNQSSIADPLADHANNTLTSLMLFNALKDFPNLKKVVYSSAGCTVAEKTFDTAHATQEDAPVSLYLDSPYQISKIIGELYGNYYQRLYGLPLVKARFQNVYGPGEVLGAGRWRGTPATVWRNVTPTFIYKALCQEALPVEGNGDATRDFIYVGDIVDGLICCALYGKVGEVYNLASGMETSIGELAALINEAAKNPTPVNHLPARPWDHSGKRFGSTEKTAKALNFLPAVSIREGIGRTVAWTRDNFDLITATMQKHEDNLRKCSA
jgi:nucleoside-diphosphate-sugar epimerase